MKVKVAFCLTNTYKNQDREEKLEFSNRFTSADEIVPNDLFGDRDVVYSEDSFVKNGGKSNSFC